MTFKSLIFAGALCISAATAHATTPAPFKTNADQGVFLIVTDIHFNPFTVPDIVPDLDQNPVDQWPLIFANGNKTTGFQYYGKDAGYPVTDSALQAASETGLNFDYVLYTGDYLSHGFNKQYDEYAGPAPKGLTQFAVKTAQYVSNAITAKIPNVPVIGILGNTDSACGDYMVAPEGQFTAGLKPQWQQLTGQSDAFDDFDIGGFYKISHPTVADQDIIALNNIFWSTKYQDKCNQNGGTPGDAMMAWLEWELYQSQLKGRKVQILLHIPPGMNSYSTSRAKGTCQQRITPFWHPTYEEQFLALMDKFSDTVHFTFSGHTHMDSFTVIRDAKGQPNIAGHITPAVSPIFDNNPAFAAYLYDKKTGDVLDSATWHLVNLKEASQGAKPVWELGYTFARTYGTPDMTATSLSMAAEKINTDRAIQKQFVSLYPALSTYSNPITADNLAAFTCALTDASAKSFEACYCGAE